jgi:hypothetical protein
MHGFDIIVLEARDLDCLFGAYRMGIIVKGAVGGTFSMATCFSSAYASKNWEEQLPFRPVAPEHAWRASSITILPWSGVWSRFHATKVPVIPLPIMTVSAISGTCLEER